MTRKASGKQQVLTIKRKRPNGEIYVYERVSEYNPDKRYYVQVSSKLIGKILPGETEIIPTRPKKNSKKKNEENSKQATRNNGLSLFSVKIFYILCFTPFFFTL